MNIRYDTQADAAYIYLVETPDKVAETKELSDEIFVDYDKAGRPLGIEIIGVKDRVPSNTLRYLKSQQKRVAYNA
jgi:uncharacterized protein YuzE